MKKRIALVIAMMLLVVCSACSNNDDSGTVRNAAESGNAGAAGTSSERKTLPAGKVLKAEDVAVGNMIVFGSYEQDNNPGNGPEPVEWLVLDVQDGKALLLSRYGLDAREYHTEREGVTWETSELRAWLNYDFQSTAFSAEERAAILTVTVDNSSVQGFDGWKTSGGNNTQDKVFLLSCAEANRYLDVRRIDNKSTNIKARVAPTAYAVARGTSPNSTGFRTADGQLSDGWWLRSPGRDEECAAYVADDGTLLDGYAHNGGECSIRPAVWLDMNAGAAFYESIPEPEVSVPGPKSIHDASLAIGDTVVFGNYEQDIGPDSSGPEPLEWTVLDIRDGKALLVTRFGLEAKPFNDISLNVVWEDCTLRAFLNSSFIYRAFSEEEKSAILKTTVDNSSAQACRQWNTYGGRDTQDMVFLLSYAEVNRYMDVIYKEAGFSDNRKARVAPTEFARRQDAGTDYYSRTDDDRAAACWWLRSPGPYSYTAAVVYYDGGLNYAHVNDSRWVVRPALWVNLQ